MVSASTRWLIGIGVGVAALVVVSIVVAVMGRDTAAALPEDTPEGVVQRFLTAVEDRDYARAQGYLTARLRSVCTVSHIRETLRWREENARDIRAELLSKEALDGGRVQVRIRVTEVGVSPPFGVSELNHDEVFLLVQEAGAWRIDEPPWPVGYCPGLEKPTARLD